jgi:hypothetical protein
MHAQLGEFSGVATVAPLDQTAVINSGLLTATVTNPAADVASGDLVVMCTRWTLASAASATFTDILNNNMAAIHMGDTGTTSQVRQSSFSYGIVPAIAAALPLGTAPWPYDSAGSAAPATGSTATVTLAANPTKAYTVAAYSGEMAQTGATADAGEAFSLIMGSAIQQHRLSVAAGVGNFAQKDRTGLAFKGALNQAVTVNFGGALATILESVTVAAYLR